MKKKTNFPLFNIESVINENINRINKNKKQNNNHQKVLQIQTINEPGYKEIMQKKIDYKHSSIFSGCNNSPNNKNNKNSNNVYNINCQNFLLFNSNLSINKDISPINNYAPNKLKKAEKQKSEKILDFIQTNSTFSEISYGECRDNTIENLKNCNNKIFEENNELNEIKNKNLNQKHHGYKNKNFVSLINVDGSKKKNERKKNNLKAEIVLYENPLKTINKLYSYINTNNENHKKNKANNTNLRNSKKIFYDIMTYNQSEEDKLNVLTGRYSDKNHCKNKENKFIEITTGEDNTKEKDSYYKKYKMNIKKLGKSKSKSKSQSKTKNKISNDQLKTPISFYKHINFLNKNIANEKNNINLILKPYNAHRNNNFIRNISNLEMKSTNLNNNNYVSTQCNKTKNKNKIKVDFSNTFSGNNSKKKSLKISRNITDNITTQLKKNNKYNNIINNNKNLNSLKSNTFANDHFIRSNTSINNNNKYSKKIIINKNFSRIINKCYSCKFIDIINCKKKKNMKIRENKNNKSSKNNSNEFINYINFCANYTYDLKKTKTKSKNKSSLPRKSSQIYQNFQVPPLNLVTYYNYKIKDLKAKSTNIIFNKFKSTDYSSESKSKSKSTKRIDSEENKLKYNSFIIKKRNNGKLMNRRLNPIKNSVNKIKNKSNNLLKNINNKNLLNFGMNVSKEMKRNKINKNHSALNILNSCMNNNNTFVNENKYNINSSLKFFSIISTLNNNNGYYSQLNFNNNSINTNYNISLTKSSTNNLLYTFKEDNKSKLKKNKTVTNSCENLIIENLVLYNDIEKNFSVKKGDLLVERYEIIKILGKGTFGICCKCYDRTLNENVCVKIIKNSSKFNEQSKIEINILKELNTSFIKKLGIFVEIKNYFEHDGRTYIVLELLSINLYEEIQNSNYVGFDLPTVRKFAIQILFGLLILQSKNIIHCDLKPENILLINKGKTGIKIIDFGSSCYSNQKMYSYIQSRFYRAPEIILGLDYNLEIDMWSFGCILCELYCGIPIFPGESEYDMLYYMMEYFGLPPKDLIENSINKLNYFTEDCKPLEKPNSFGKIRRPNKKNIESFLLNADEDFIDLIKNILKWKKEERFKPQDALKHKWIIKNMTNEALKSHLKKIEEYLVDNEDKKNESIKNDIQGNLKQSVNNFSENGNTFKFMNDAGTLSSLVIGDSKYSSLN